MSSAMHRNGSDCRECLFFGACAVALVLASPFLALALFTLRPVLLVLALIALVLIVSPLVIVPRMRGPVAGGHRARERVPRAAPGAGCRRAPRA